MSCSSAGSAEPIAKEIWTDITEKCRAAAALMTNGKPMVSTSEFNLLDSMTAVELMDPKMDQCVGMVGGPKEMKDILVVDYPAGEVISPAVTLKLLQSLFVHEVSFLDGASLMEGMLRCIFLWDAAWPALEERATEMAKSRSADAESMPELELVGESVVLSYCKSLQKTVSHIFKAVLAADVYEDEDFQPMHQEHLCEKLDDASICAQIDSIAAVVKAKISANQIQRGTSPLKGSLPHRDTAVLELLLALLECRRSLHCTYSKLGFFMHDTIARNKRGLPLSPRSSSDEAEDAERGKGGAAAAAAKSREGTTTTTTATTTATTAAAEAVGGTSCSDAKEKLQYCTLVSDLQQFVQTSLISLKAVSDALLNLKQYPGASPPLPAAAAAAAASTTTAADTDPGLEQLSAQVGSLSMANIPSELPKPGTTNQHADLLSTEFGPSAGADACPEIFFAYNEALVKLTQNSPVRVVPQRSFSAAVAYHTKVFEELEEMCRQAKLLLTCYAQDVATPDGGVPSVGVNFEQLLIMTLHFSSEKYHLMSRSFLMSVLYIFYNDLAGMVTASMFDRGLPPMIVRSEVIQRQWTNPASVAWDTLRALCVHRNRLLTRLESVLNSWGTVSQEAAYLDHQFGQAIDPERAAKDAAAAAASASGVSNVAASGEGAGAGEDVPPPAARQQWIGCWVALYAALVMDLYMELLVEMDLLEPSEWDYFYWYWDYICTNGSWAMQSLRELRSELNARLYESELVRLMMLSREQEDRGAGGGAVGKAGSTSVAEGNGTAAAAVSAEGVSVSNTTTTASSKSKKKKKKNAQKNSTAAAQQGNVDVGVGFGDVSMPVSSHTQSAREALQAMPAPPHPLRPTTLEIFVYGRSLLLRGISRTLVVACRLGLIDKTGNKYTSWNCRFSQRFGAFERIVNPPPLTHSDYARVVSSESASSGSRSSSDSKNNSVSGSSKNNNIKERGGHQSEGDKQQGSVKERKVVEPGKGDMEEEDGAERDDDFVYNFAVSDSSSKGLANVAGSAAHWLRNSRAAFDQLRKVVTADAAASSIAAAASASAPASSPAALLPPSPPTCKTTAGAASTTTTSISTTTASLAVPAVPVIEEEVKLPVDLILSEKALQLTKVVVAASVSIMKTAQTLQSVGLPALAPLPPSPSNTATTTTSAAVGGGGGGAVSVVGNVPPSELLVLSTNKSFDCHYTIVQIEKKS